MLMIVRLYFSIDVAPPVVASDGGKGSLFYPGAV